MSRPIPSTYCVYIPGVGFTITRANIDAYQKQLAEDRRPAATPAEVVMAFATDTTRKCAAFPESKTYKRRVGRAMRLMKKG